MCLYIWCTHFHATIRTPLTPVFQVYVDYGITRLMPYKIHLSVVVYYWYQFVLCAHICIQSNASAILQLPYIFFYAWKRTSLIKDARLLIMIINKITLWRLGYQSNRLLQSGPATEGLFSVQPRYANADNRTRTCTVSNQNLNLTCLPIPPYQLKFILFSTIPYHKVYSLRQHELFRVAIFQCQAHQ